MVDLTVYATAGNFNMRRHLSLTTIFEKRSPGTNVFFSNSDVYGATAFAAKDADGRYSNDLFVGAAVISPTGEIGFAPEARLSGEINGREPGSALASFLDVQSAREIEAYLLRSDDRILGNDGNDTLRGHGGNDMLDGGAGADTVVGGGGADLLFTGAVFVNFNSPIDRAIGGPGDDVVVFASGRNMYAEAQGGKGADLYYMPSQGFANVNYRAGVSSGQSVTDPGADTFYFSGADKAFVNAIFSFETGVDKIQLDPAFFTAIAGGLTADNFVFGQNVATPRDADDHILVASEAGLIRVFYDPDGNGREKLLELFRARSAAPTVEDFTVGHLDVPTSPAATRHEGLVAFDHQPWPADLNIHLV